MMKKLQAAMEYLMTYGWAILIIALALVVLSSLGVFNPNKFRPVGCFLPAPFSCQIGGFTSGGKLNITLIQASGQQITVTNVACVDNSHILSTGLPDNNCGASCWTSYSVNIASGSSANLNNIQCYPSGNSGFGTQPIGYVFSGALVINYTTPSGRYVTSGSINAQVNKP